MEPLDLQRSDEPVDPLHLRFRVIRFFRYLRALAKAGDVGDDHVIVVRQVPCESCPEVFVAGETVQEQNRLPFSSLQIRDLMIVDLDLLRDQPRNVPFTQLGHF